MTRGENEIAVLDRSVCATYQLPKDREGTQYN